jgi:NTE family protein
MMFNKIKFILSFLILLSFPGCHKSHYQFDQLPDKIPDVVFEKREIGVALVLGGGGARGMFHVGVIEVLQEAKIPIDLIVGCSAGAVVGALYADNPCGIHLKYCLIALRRKDLLEFSVFSCRYGLCKGKALKQFLHNNLSVKNFEELKIPFIAVSTDLRAGEVINLGCGPIIPAVHASCAVPFFFEPVKLYGRILVDGGVLDPNPVASAKLFSPKMIIAVDLAELLPVTHPTTLFGIATRSAEIIHLKQSRSCLAGANVIIRPSLKPIGMFDDSHTYALYIEGKRAATEVLSEIQDFYEKHVCSPGP